MEHREVIEKELRAVLLPLIEQQLAPAIIQEVSFKIEEDFEGDELLRVTVVYEIEGDRLNPKGVRGLARHFREPLEKLNEAAFPVFTFLTSEDAKTAAA